MRKDTTLRPARAVNFHCGLAAQDAIAWPGTRRVPKKSLTSVRLFYALAVALGLFGVGGCATSNGVANLQGHGTKQVFNAPFEPIWTASMDAVYANQLTLLMTNLSGSVGYISAERGLSRSSVGETIGIWVVPVSPTETQIEVVSRQKAPWIWSRNWERPLLQAIGENVRSLPTPTVAAAGETSKPPDNVPARNLPVVAAPATNSPESAAAPGRAGGDTTVELTRRRDELRTYEALRAEELRLEKDPRRRERLQAELDYLREELSSVEDRIARHQQIAK